VLVPGAPVPPAPGRVVPGSVVPGSVVPGSVVPGSVVPGPVVPGPVVPGPVVPGPVVPGPVVPGPVVPGPVVPPVRPGQPLPGGVVPGGAFPVVPPSGFPVREMPIDRLTPAGPIPNTQPMPGTHPPPADNPHPVPDPLGPHVPALPVPAGPVLPGPPVDGMRPIDDIHLHDLQRLLSTSLGLAGPIDEVVGRLRELLVQAAPQLVAALPGTPETQREQLRAALVWLVDNLDHPPVIAAGCGQFGGALREFGVQPQQLQLMGAALAEALRAGMANGWRQEYDAAWRSTWKLAHRWIAHGAEAAAYQPIAWTAVVIEHELRRSDLAVLRLRPYLPMPFRPGQYARIEVPELPGVWRPYSLAGAPQLDNVLELHVRAKGETGVSGALVHRTQVGDKVRLSRAEGHMALPAATERDLLFIAGDTGLAPVKALLTELAVTDDPRSAVLFWGVRTLDELYDIEEVAAIARACRRATVVPVISEGEPGPYASGLVTDAVAAYGEWSEHEVYLAGPPPMLATTSAVLTDLGIDADRIHHDAPEP
jgi:NAD(P)H-flavin reductase